MYSLSWLLHPCLPADAGHTQVPEYSSKCRPDVHLTSVCSPSMQLKKMLHTVGSGWAKNPLRRGQFSLALGGSVWRKMDKLSFKIEIEYIISRY